MRITPFILPVFVLTSYSGLAQAPVTEQRPTVLQTADETPRIQTFEQALEQDASAYAQNFGVSLAEGKRRLLAMRDSMATTDELRQTYGDRFVGVSIEHKPTFQISVLLTGETPVPTRTISAGGMSVPIVFRTGARSTIGELRAAQEKNFRAIRNMLPNTQGTGIDVRTGELVIIVKAVGAAASQAVARKPELEALTGVPVRVETVNAVSANADVRGGSRYEANHTDGWRYYCTTGFTVYNSSTTAIATAAHCPDGGPTYYNPNGTSIPLTLVGSWGSSTQDVQILTSSYAERAEFYVDTNKTTVGRPVGRYTLGATRAGDSVCHRGETTGASCSTVELVYYQPPGENCGGYCSPTWVSVYGPYCKGGDSGGPVYILDLAHGLLKGSMTNTSTGECIRYWYMNLDYLPSGWYLLQG